MCYHTMCDLGMIIQTHNLQVGSAVAFTDSIVSPADHGKLECEEYIM